MQVHAFPHCCGMAIVTHFGHDTRHAWRPENGQSVDQIETELRGIAANARTRLFTSRGTDLGAVGMLVCALNNHQRDALHDMLIRLGWRRAGKASNLHTAGETNVYMYRKVIEEERNLS